MTIVRELVTKINFSFNKRDVESFNQAIDNFRKRFLVTSAVATTVVTGFVKLAKSVSDGILDASELSRSTNTALEDLVALQRVASRFRISENQFSGAFTKLNQLVKDAEFGFGELFKIARHLEIEVTDNNNNLLATEIIFERIIEALSDIRDESLRFDIARNIFGEGKFSDLAKTGIDNIRKLKEELRPLGKELAQNEESAREFDQSFTKLFESIGRFTNLVVPPFFKLLSQSFQGLTDIITTISKPIDESAKPFFKQRVIEQNEEINRNIAQALANSSEEVRQRFNDRRVTVTNNITVQPPLGYEETQREFFEEAAEKIIGSSIEDTFQEVLNNFPEVE